MNAKTEKEIPDGYVSWDGGENPVPGKHVAIIMASVHSYLNGDAGLSDRLRWTHNKQNPVGDIIAYRVI